jgi:hypothetical protein
MLIGFSLMAFFLLSFQENSTPKKYHHMMIYSEHYDMDNVFISIDGKEYKEMHLDKQIKGPWDFNPIINLIYQYENEGWEFYSGGIQYYHLRRERE